MKALVIGDLALIAGGTIGGTIEHGANIILGDPYGAVSGVAANIAYDIRGLGIDVDLAGAVGTDPFGDAILDDLRGQEIDVRHVQRLAEPTSVFLIVVDGVAERTMIGYRGASGAFTLDHRVLLDSAPAWVHMSGYTMLNPTMPASFAHFAAAARERGIPCSLDLEGIAGTGTRLDLTGLTILCNREEYRAYAGTDDVRRPEGAHRLVVKAGSEGCFLADDLGVQNIPALPTTVCDLTGAGDAFNAGFIAAQLRGIPAEEACRWGNAAASLKVAKRGPRIDLTVEHIERMVAADR